MTYSIIKNFQILEKVRLQFRGEFFNLLNHANLGGANATVNSPNFGLISSATGPRVVQLALKVLF